MDWYFVGVKPLRPLNRPVYRFFKDESDPTSLSENYIYNLFEDSSNRLWVATGDGLNLLLPSGNSFKRYGSAQGLPDKVVACVEQDQRGNVWLGTFNGLARLDPQTDQITHYYRHQGLQSNKFSLGACGHTARGELLFGGQNGFNRFMPDSVDIVTPTPAIRFSDFMLFNRSVPVGQSSASDAQTFVLPKPIESLQKLTLGYQQSHFTLGFAAFDYLGAERVQYRFKLKDYDRDWIPVDTRFRRATYTNVPAGDYTLQIEARNASWQGGAATAELGVRIDPPWWDTWQARLIYLLCAAGAHLLAIAQLSPQNGSEKQPIAGG